jgi:hypothetical protein
MNMPLHYTRSFFYLIFIIFLQISIFSTSCLTDLDYSLSHLKNTDAVVSTQQSFHGNSSAELSVDSEGNYVRIYIYLDEPLLLEDLDQLSMWINPQLGDGTIEIEFYLDGDGDGSYNSKDLQDARISSQEKSWSELEMSWLDWNELDGFDLEYDLYKDKSFLSQSLDACKSKLEGKRIVKLYITIRKNGQAPTSAFIDYIKIGDQIISFEPLEREDLKDGPTSASPGGLITYIITYGNNQLQPTDVIVNENYDQRTVFIESYPLPDPGTNNVWTFRDLPPGAHGQIKIRMRTIKPSARASIDGHISGSGFTCTRGMLSTEAESYLVKNNVRISAGKFNFLASATTTIRPIVGSTLQFGEHGSGYYRADEKLTYNSAIISAQRDVLGVRSLASANFSQNFIVRPPPGGWSARLRAENDYRDILWSDRYIEAKNLNLSYKMQLGKTLSYLETSAQVLGLADRTARWPGGSADTRLAGNFSFAGKARWKWANRTVSPDKAWLECCPLVQE